MKPFYSIREIADLLNEDVCAVCNGLVASGVPAYFNGKGIELAEYNCFRPIRSGETIYINLGKHPDPSPDTVIVSIETLPESWVQSLGSAEGVPLQEESFLEPESSTTQAIAADVSLCPNENGPTRDEWIFKRVKVLRAARTKDFLCEVAREISKSVSAVKQAIARHEKRHDTDNDTNGAPSSIAGMLQAAARQKK
jgi:hypothetical protein